ncbi:MAG TPA: hypothetical protein VGQ51_13160 [Puia sp.]|jgi:hypothetical protein|nr:hypothetical protein [Puia sp.]
MKRLYAIALLVFAMCDHSRAQFIADNHNVPTAADGPAGITEALVCPMVPAISEPWQKEEDHVFGHIRGNRLAMMKNTSEDIISLLHDSILTDGSFRPIWHGEYFSSGNGAPQMRFGLSCVFYNGDENSNSPGDLTIFANDISPLLGRLTVNGHEFTTLKGFTGGQDRPGFEFDMPADAGDSVVHIKAWLVTADSSVLPYIPVSRKEYLEQARQELESRRDAVIADIKSRIQIRPSADQEAAKQQALDQLRATYSGIDLQAHTRVFLSNYKSDEEYMKQNIAVNTEDLDRTLAIIARLITSSTTRQLAQPAVVSVAAADFHGFEDGMPNSTVLVRLRPSWYGADTDQTTIKSLLICWRYRPADRMAAGIDRQLALRNPIPRLRKQFHTVSMEKSE